jgi:hypothetical protein
MAEQSIVQVGNALIILAGNNDRFNDGLTTGYIEFYDEHHRPTLPLTGHVICDHLLTILNEPSASSFWKAGRSTSWVEALLENSPHTFRSVLPEGRITVLQEV